MTYSDYENGSYSNNDDNDNNYSGDSYGAVGNDARKPVPLDVHASFELWLAKQGAVWDLPDMPFVAMKVLAGVGLLGVTASSVASMVLLQDDPTFRGSFSPATQVIDAVTAASASFLALSLIAGIVGIVMNNRSLLGAASALIFPICGFLHTRYPNNDIRAAGAALIIMASFAIYCLERLQERIDDEVMDGNMHPKQLSGGACGGDISEAMSASRGRVVAYITAGLSAALGLASIIGAGLLEPHDTTVFEQAQFFAELPNFIVGTLALLTAIVLALGAFMRSRSLLHAALASSVMTTVVAGGCFAISYRIFNLYNVGLPGRTGFNFCDTNIEDCHDKKKTLLALAVITLCHAVLNVFSGWAAKQVSQTLSESPSPHDRFISVLGRVPPLSLLKIRSLLFLAIQLVGGVLIVTHGGLISNVEGGGNEKDAQDMQFVIGFVTLAATAVGAYATLFADRGFLLFAFSLSAVIQTNAIISLGLFYSYRAARDANNVSDATHELLAVAITGLALGMFGSLLSMWGHWDLSEAKQALSGPVGGMMDDTFSVDEDAPVNDDSDYTYATDNEYSSSDSS